MKRLLTDLLRPSPSAIDLQKNCPDGLRHPLHRLKTVLGHFAEGKVLDVRSVDGVFDFRRSVLPYSFNEVEVFLRLPKPPSVHRFFRQSGKRSHFAVEQTF